MTRAANSSPAPLAAYTTDAERYDCRTALFQCWRDLAVDALALQAGDHVVDVGCGTGLCFARLESAIGVSGQITGIDEAPPMLVVARRRVERHAWRNVELIAGPAHLARLSYTADAALFCAVHDVLQDREALLNVLAQLRPGGQVSAIGGRWADPSLVAYNAVIRSLHAPYIKDFGAFDRPWTQLEELLEDTRVGEIAFGSGYLLAGSTSGRRPAPA